MTSIYLVRHCQAQGNVNRVFQGRIDSEMSEEGRRQLDRLAERFRRIPLDAGSVHQPAATGPANGGGAEPLSWSAGTDGRPLY